MTRSVLPLRTACAEVPLSEDAHRRCPLCLGEQVHQREVVSVEALRGLYESMLGPAVREEFGNRPEVITLVACESCRLGYFAPPLEGTGRLYALLHAFPWYYEESKPEFATVARYLPVAGRVLEIGCGAGHFRRFVPGCSYVGLEPSPSARSQALAAGIDVRDQSIEEHALQFARGYEAVVAFQVLEHVSSPRAFLDAAAQSLSPGGVLAISVPSCDGYLGAARNYTLNLPPHHQTLWSDETLETIGRILGATLVALVHEPLRPIHVVEYRRLRIERLLDRLRGAGQRFVDVSRGAAICSRIAATLATVQPFPIPRPGSVGHTVTAVFRMGGPS